MTRRRIFTAIITVVGAVLALAFFQDAWKLPFARLVYDVAVFAVAMAVVGRLRPARTTRGEILRFCLGIGIHLIIGLTATATTIVAISETVSPGEASWLLLFRIPYAFSIAFSALSLIRMAGVINWNRRRRTVLIFASIAMFFVIVNAPSPIITILALVFVLFIKPWPWLDSLAGKRGGWLILLLFILAPIGFLLFLSGLTGGTGDDVTVTLSAGIADAMFSSRFYDLLGNIIAFTWFAIPLKLTVALFQGLFGIRIPIWLKFGTTYVFSTLIPGLLLLMLIAVWVYVGIGSSRAQLVRDLIHEDLRDLEQALVNQRLFTYQPEDSVAAANYRRIFPSSETGQLLPPLPPPVRGEPGFGTPSPEAPSAESWEMYSRIDSLVQEMGAMELWVKDADIHGSWTLPDTLEPFPGWTYAETERHGILPLDSTRAAYAAAVVEAGNAALLHIAMQPLTMNVLREYKETVGSDITLYPLEIIQVGEDDENVRYKIEGEDGRHGTDIKVSTTEDTDGLAWHERVVHGVSELESWPGLGNSSTMVGQVVVHTSLGDLMGNMWAWEGLNRFVLIGLIAIAALFGLAVLFSTLLAGGITRTIMRSVKELRQGTERLRQGDLEVQITPRSNDELGDLALSFNYMTADLRRMISEVTVKERLEREIQIARRIQIHLLPTELPQRPTLQVGAHSDPAFEVGGDYYDCIDLGERGLLVVLGDVSGKGVGAAVLMSNLQASLSLLATQDLTLAEMVRQLNIQVCKNSTPEMFITFFAGLFNPELGTLRYVNAGHDVPFVIRYGKPIDLESGGMLLGIMKDGDYTCGEMEIQPGDLFCAYSDGLTEAMNATDEEFGRDRLIHTLDEFKHLDPHLLVSKVLQTIRDYAGLERAGQDDLTLITVKVTED